MTSRREKLGLNVVLSVVPNRAERRRAHLLPKRVVARRENRDQHDRTFRQFRRFGQFDLPIMNKPLKAN